MSNWKFTKRGKLTGRRRFSFYTNHHRLYFTWSWILCSTFLKNNAVWATNSVKVKGRAKRSLICSNKMERQQNRRPEDPNGLSLTGFLGRRSQVLWWEMRRPQTLMFFTMSLCCAANSAEWKVKSCVQLDGFWTARSWCSASSLCCRRTPAVEQLQLPGGSEPPETDPRQWALLHDPTRPEPHPDHLGQSGGGSVRHPGCGEWL